jgi:hypothetical protein
MAQNLLKAMPLLEAWDLDILTSEMGVPFPAVGLVSRKKALAKLREVASLRFLPFAAPARAVLRKLKIKIALVMRPRAREGRAFA